MIRVLLIDDDSALSDVIITALPKEEFSIYVSNSGKGGISDAKRLRPDFILLDQILPDISGNKVLEALKLDESISSIPVVFLSGFSSDKLIEIALKTGAVEYIQKQDFDVNGLASKIKQIIAKNPSK